MWLVARASLGRAPGVRHCFLIRITTHATALHKDNECDMQLMGQAINSLVTVVTQLRRNPVRFVCHCSDVNSRALSLTHFHYNVLLFSDKFLFILICLIGYTFMSTVNLLVQRINIQIDRDIKDI